MEIKQFLVEKSLFWVWQVFQKALDASRLDSWAKWSMDTDNEH